jgi:tetratricopeptide (TPR) repeat protein
MAHTLRFRRLRALALASGSVALLCAHPARAAAQYVNYSIHIRESMDTLYARFSRDTNDPVAYYNLAMGYWSKKKYDSADVVFRKAAALDPEFALAHLAIALVQLPNKDHWQHLKRTAGDTALQRELRFREREYARAFMIDPFLDARPLGMFPMGYEAAYVVLSRVIAYREAYFAAPLDSMPAPLLWLHTLAAAHTNHVREAIADVQILAKLAGQREQSDSMSPAPLLANQYLFMLAALYQRIAFNTNAIHLYQAVLANDIGNYEAHVQLARIYESEGGWRDALAERRAAIAVFPENPRLLLDLGVTQYHAGALADAEATLRQAQAAGPRDPYVYYWLGVVQRAHADTTDAHQDFTSFLRLAPSRDTAQIAAVRRSLDSLGVHALRPDSGR